jgi:hypothetical protein
MKTKKIPCRVCKKWFWNHSAEEKLMCIQKWDLILKKKERDLKNEN